MTDHNQQAWIEKMIEKVRTETIIHLQAGRPLPTGISIPPDGLRYITEGEPMLVFALREEGLSKTLSTQCPALTVAIKRRGNEHWVEVSLLHGLPPSAPSPEPPSPTRVETRICLTPDECRQVAQRLRHARETLGEYPPDDVTRNIIREVFIRCHPGLTAGEASMRQTVASVCRMALAYSLMQLHLLEPGWAAGEHLGHG